MRRHWDGSIQSSNTPTWDKTGLKREDYAVYRCLVTQVLYVDDDQNISKNSQNPEVLYEVVILGGAPSGQTLSNCRLAGYLGGDTNHSERTLTATSKDISDVRLEDNDGDIVYVQFNQGHDAYPVIIGLAKGLHDTTGAALADGPRLLDFFNGFQTNINNKGEYSRTLNGGSTSNGRFTPGTSAILNETWSQDEKLTRTYKSGLVVTEDGANDKVAMTTSGGASVTLDGKGMTISIKAGSTEVLIDGNSGNIALKGQTVDLGSSTSDFVTMFTALASAWAQHTHPFTDITPGGPVPSMTQPPNAPLLSTVGSQTVKVQS